MELAQDAGEHRGVEALAADGGVAVDPDDVESAEALGDVRALVPGDHDLVSAVGIHRDLMRPDSRNSVIQTGLRADHSREACTPSIGVHAALFAHPAE